MNWTVTNDFPTGYTVLDAIWASHLERYVALAISNSAPFGDRFLISSPDAVTWDVDELTGLGDITGIVYSPDLGRFVVFGNEDGDIAYGDTLDVGDWTELPAELDPDEFNTIQAVWDGLNDQFILGNGDKLSTVGDLATSPDGATWTLQNSGMTPSGSYDSPIFEVFVVGDDKLIATGLLDDNSGSNLYTSTDGIAWTDQGKFGSPAVAVLPRGSFTAGFHPTANVNGFLLPGKQRATGFDAGAVITDGTTSGLAVVFTGNAGFFSGLQFSNLYPVSASLAIGTTWRRSGAEPASYVYTSVDPDWNEWDPETVPEDPDNGSSWEFLVWSPDLGQAIAFGGDTQLLVSEPIAGFTLTSITPDEGDIRGGDVVTLAGSGFEEGMTARFGDDDWVTCNVISPTSATCITPAHAAGVVDVRARNPLGEFADLEDAFTYSDTFPFVTSIVPDHGPMTGGTPVTINGGNFPVNVLVTFDGLAATSIVRVDETEITCVTPAHTVGPVDVAIIEI